MPCGVDGIELALLLTAPLHTPCTVSKGKGAFSCFLSLKHGVVGRILRWHQNFCSLVYTPCIISPLSLARAYEYDRMVISLIDYIM